MGGKYGSKGGTTYATKGKGKRQEFPQTRYFSYGPDSSFFDGLAQALGVTTDSWNVTAIKDRVKDREVAAAPQHASLLTRGASSSAGGSSHASPQIGAAMVPPPASTGAPGGAGAPAEQEHAVSTSIRAGAEAEASSPDEDGPRDLSAKGKEKVKKAIADATSMDELMELEDFLNGSVDADEDLIQKLGLVDEDFLDGDSDEDVEQSGGRAVGSSAAAGTTIPGTSAGAAGGPAGAVEPGGAGPMPGSGLTNGDRATSSTSVDDMVRGLSALDVSKIKAHIDDVESLEELEELETALQTGALSRKMAEKLGIDTSSLDRKRSAGGKSSRAASPKRTAAAAAEVGGGEEELLPGQVSGAKDWTLEDEEFEDDEDEWRPELDADDYDPLNDEWEKDPYELAANALEGGKADAATIMERIEQKREKEREARGEKGAARGGLQWGGQDGSPGGKEKSGRGVEGEKRSLSAGSKGKSKSPRARSGGSKSPRGEATPGSKATSSAPVPAKDIAEGHQSPQPMEVVDENREDLDDANESIAHLKNLKRPHADKQRGITMKNCEFWRNWTTVLRRTRQHPNFQRWVSPPFGAQLPRGWRRAEEPVLSGPTETCRRLAITTTTVFVGDVNVGFDPKHLARVTVVGGQGETAGLFRKKTLWTRTYSPARSLF